MKRRYGARVGVALLVVALGVVAVTQFVRHGFSAHEEPWAVEAFVARHLRNLAIPAGAREQQNPVPPTPEVLAEARAHFADHCAICHANDGSGNTTFGQNLYPPPPDLRKAHTQSLSDGEIFYIIRNGVRFTGMPAFGVGDPADDTDSWKLVRFIRHLPEISQEELAEMETLNPKSPKEIREEEAMQRFLSGGAPPADANGHDDHHH